MTLVVNNPVGINSPIVDAFTIYPNPASIEARVSGVDCDLIEVYSLLENKLLEVNNSTIIPVSSLTTGVYIVKINGFTKQLLVK